MTPQQSRSADRFDGFARGSQCADVACTRSRVCGRLAALLGVMATFATTPGCADSTLTAKDAGSAKHAAGDAGRHDAAASPDAARRVKVRPVAIDLARVATRELTAGADGEPIYGPIEPLDDADVCIVQRRDALAAFEPFEPVKPPICVRSVAGQIVHIEGVPANSDLVITVEHEGLQPLAFTDRTNDSDVGSPPWGFAYSIVLLKPGAADRLVDPTTNAGPNHGLVALWAGVLWSGRGETRSGALAGKENLFGSQDTVAWSPNLRVVIEPAGGGESFETRTTLSGLRLLSLPAGSARVKFINEDARLNCRPSGGGNGELAGLPVSADTLELPVLAGHNHTVGVTCTCGAGPDDGELLDLGPCSFAPADAAGADGGSP